MKTSPFLILPLLLLLVVGSSIAQTDYYVDPNTGNDSNTGTITLPLLTIAKAISKQGNNGGTIYLRAGSYNMSGSLTAGKAGTATNMNNIYAYPGENPVLNFSSMTGSSDGVKLSGSYYHLYGLEIIGAGHNGINVSGKNNIIENCNVHSNRNSGIQMGSSSDLTSWPSNNLFLNCDSWLNYDAPIGGNADGFAIKWNIGKNNVLRGCRSYNNSDDGYDLWMADSTLIIDSCYAFRNGVDSWGQTGFNGNGNGFKLGGNYIATTHYVSHCVSFDNAGNTGRGYDENNNTAPQVVYNCVAYRDKGDNFHFNNTLVSGQHLIRNCISYLGNNTISSATISNNSWQGYTPAASDFISIDTTLATAPRQANGSLPDNGFFRLAAGSQFIDAGYDVGFPIYGSAPDIGAFEFNPLLPVELVSFSGVIEGNIVKLRWNTATELNNMGFAIEKSYDKNSWSTIGFINGNGNSTSMKSYSYSDKLPRQGKSYYRLKQTDVNGTLKYSEAIEINFDSIKKFNLHQNYPNPFNPSTVIRFDTPFASNVNIKVYNIIGKEVAELLNEKLDGGSHEVLFKANNLTSGLYIYKITAGSFTFSRKMMLVK